MTLGKFEKLFDSIYDIVSVFFDKQSKQKLELIQQMKSKNNSIARNAVDTLRKKRDDYRKEGYIGGGGWTTLVEEDFSGANLQGADISGVGFVLKKSNLCNADLRNAILDDTILDEANLTNADLRGAKMKEVHLLGAELHHAKLQGADLQMGHLHAADFSFANFEGADLWDARMTEANFFRANFHGTTLEHADFTNANLEGAIFGNNLWGEITQGGNASSKPKLPDGSRLVSEEDLKRFTDRNHPNFWRPDEPVAWGGKDGIQKHSDLSDLDLSRNDHY